jgi:hypothetical protein
VWPWRFWQAFGRGGWGIFARRDFFLNVMVGGDGGVVSPKKLVGWVGTVTYSRAYTPPNTTLHQGRSIVFYHSVEIPEI